MTRRLLTCLLAVLLLGTTAAAGHSTPAQVTPDAAASPDIQRARTVLSDVLSRREFTAQAADSVLVRAQRRIANWLADLWQRLGLGGLAGKKTTKVFAWVIAFAALCGLGAWLFRSLTRASRGARLAITAPPSRRKSARAWAAAAAHATDLRDVVRYAYSATVTRLEEEGAWKPDAARTPREHLRLLAADHRRRPVVADVARRFEEVWFAARTPTDDDRQALLARLKELGCLS